ncbi:hypothetical protein EPN81_01100 [Patescibacteria group bacterium]|nr:MAG: hypothetical protein EPN81_01100 [Patescibacteria group bacterium]
MLDSFRLSHRQVVFTDERRRYISDSIFEVAGNLAAVALDPPDRTLLGTTHSVWDNMSLYGLWVRQHFRRIRSQNKHVGNAHFAHPNDKLLEVILLHKVMQKLDPCESEELQIAHHAVGAMIQHTLTLMLAEIRLEQWTRIFNLWKLQGMSARDWTIHIAGASAATYTLMTLAMRDGSAVYLPTGYEDVTLGIDLFWKEDGKLHAVSVKCVTGQDNPVLAWRVHELPTRTNDRIATDRRNIYLGAQRFSASEKRLCIPVLVYVGKPEGGPVRLNHDWGRLTWPDQLLAPEHHVLVNGHDFAR